MCYIYEDLLKYKFREIKLFMQDFEFNRWDLMMGILK